MMWDPKGSQSYLDGSRSPIPRFPIPQWALSLTAEVLRAQNNAYTSPGTPPDMRYALTSFPR